MALLIPTITLSSGLVLANAMAVISDLSVSNNVSTSERLDVISSPGDGEAINEYYQVTITNHGGKNGSYMVSIFMDEQSFADGKPPVEQLKDGRQTKVFSMNLLADEYKDKSTREAAYLHLSNQERFSETSIIEGIAI
jgi:hypothetical protein